MKHRDTDNNIDIYDDDIDIFDTTSDAQITKLLIIYNRADCKRQTT